MRKKRRRIKPYRRITGVMGARLIFVMAFLLIVLFVIMGRLIYLGIFKQESYKKTVLAQQQYMNTEISYKRGDILDAKGNVLATSRKLYKVVLEPKNIIGKRTKKNGAEVKTENEKLITKALIKYLGVSSADVSKALSNSDSYYYDTLCERKTEEEIQGLKAYLKSEEGEDLNGIWLDESYERIYPNHTLACHAIGFVSDGDIGVGGMEQYYNSTLKGTNGRRYTYLNEELEYDTSIDEAVNGKTLVSTIDMTIQKYAEKYLNKFQKKYGSKNTSVLVMNPNNGEVLAMANSKTYDPANPMSEDNLEKYFKKSKLKKMDNKEKTNAYSSIWNNYIVSSTYEPGSTFKPFNVAMALETGVLTGDEMFTCNGYQTISGTTIRCSHVHGVIPLSTTIAKSCNDAMMQIAAKVGSKNFTKYQKEFGFGSKTGIDLPGEAGASSVLHNEDMADVDLATSSFGQSFQCTMIQLGSAFCSLINGGNYYQPHVVKQILDSNGNVEKNIGKTLVKKTVSEETCEKLKTYMRETVESGTARVAQIDEYDLAGKTGTAEKYPRGTNKRLVSFIGFAPYDNPQLMVYVTIDEIKKGSQSNTRLAVEMTRDILENSLDYMNVEQNIKQETD
ncbi:MAG: penicillin-binding protein 2 [Lachnospiraceae bacterium]|nr:penicillin-binding protein 2 [Lachnospiraceae bacterium]